jgi:two-component system, chemotaxis family, protein-glutamate methylesterase/glutaminase
MAGVTTVLIVDDSALVRKLLQAILSEDPEIKVVGTAADPFEAREKIKALSPQVITLDVEMPKMDGITFLRNLMRLRPTPVVMVSSLTEANADVTIAALEAGAVDYVEKPKVGLADGLSNMAEELCEKVKVAARARLRPLDKPLPEVTQKAAAVSYQTTDRIIAIGASTGGTEAIAEIMAELPPTCPAVMITQHIPMQFSRRFAERLNKLSPMSVSEATDRQAVLLGHAYVAPGDQHMRLERSGAKYYCRLAQDPPINRHRPAVDALFDSVAAQAGGKNSLGVILTGMGADGAEGLLTLKNAGARTIAQDRETSVVWGMPGEAVKRGAAHETLPLSVIAQRIKDWAAR